MSEDQGFEKSCEQLVVVLLPVLVFLGTVQQAGVLDLA
jgi:hypothetical protein